MVVVEVDEAVEQLGLLSRPAEFIAKPQVRIVNFAGAAARLVHIVEMLEGPAGVEQIGIVGGLADIEVANGISAGAGVRFEVSNFPSRSSNTK